MNWRVTVTAAMLVLAAAAPAHARSTLGELMEKEDCGYIWNLGPVLRDRSPEDKARAAGGALHYCVNDEGRAYIAQILQAPQKDDIGLCFLAEWDVTLLRTRAGDFYEPKNDRRSADPGDTVWMQRHDGPCPRQDDAGYIPTAGVPHGLFLSLLQFWDKIGKSPEAFQDSLALDPHNSSVISMEAADSLKQALSGSGNLRLIEARAGYPIVAIGVNAQGPAIPLMIVVDDGGGAGGYEIGVDWRGNRLRIVNISSFKY